MKEKLRVIIGAILTLGLVFLLTVSNFLSPADYVLKDLLYQIPRGINSNIKIIAIDEPTLEQYGRMGDWSRQMYADLIHTLNQDEVFRPSVIAFDLIFSGEADAAGDAAFVKEAKESGNVVVATELVYDVKPVADEKRGTYFPVSSIVYPYEDLRAVTETGFASVAQDSDSTIRRILPVEQFEGQQVDMFSKVIYETYCQKNGLAVNEIPSDKYGRSLINYSGKPGDYEHISMADVLSGKIDPKAFTGSIVLVGAYASGMQDNFNVPNGGSHQMYGVEIHANIIQSFMEGRFAINANPLLSGLIIGLCCGLIFIIFKKAKVWVATLSLVAAIAAEIFAGVQLNNHGKSIPLLPGIITLVIAYIYCLALGYIAESLKKRKVLNAFKKYVAPEIVEEISKKGDFSIKLGGENRDIAVLFVDIRGFTTMSEALKPEQVVEILNQYLQLTTEAVFKNKGTLDKYVGDCTMAMWNAPFDQENYELLAVRAAMDIVKGGEALEEELMKKYGRTIGFGVGVHCGEAVVGNIGCDFRMDYTSIGDTVNTSARLEANAKKGQVLISDVLYERLGDLVKVEPVGNIPLKGKSKELFVYSVVDVDRSL